MNVKTNTRFLILTTALLVLQFASDSSRAQTMIPPGSAPLAPPPPPAPPPPKIDVPAVPTLDQPASAPRAATGNRGSFGGRVTNCLADGAAAGLGPNERAAYSRACANR